MTADPVGGVWTYALELAAALRPAGVHVTLATMGAALTPAQRAEAAAVANVELRESTFKLEWMPDPWDDVELAGRWLLELASQVTPDVVHLNGYAHAALPFQAPTLVVAHSCVVSWFRAVKGHDAPAEFDRYRQAVRRGLDAADAIVAPTRAMLDALTACHGAREGRVIANGLNSSAFRVGPKEPFILAVGRLWDEAKNVAALTRAATRLPWPVRIAGDARDPGTGEVRAFENVEALGVLPREALAGQFARASIFAAPARYEPFGLAPLEAALGGCALVLGDLASLREVWGDAAVFVPPDDDDALAGAIGRLVDDSDGRAHLARRARTRALELGPEPFARAYLALYRELTLVRATEPGVA